jgi:MFS family permease
MTSREKWILSVVSVCHGLIHCYMLVFPTVYKSLGKALNLEFAGVGLVGMASYMGFGFGSLPAGFLSDKVGTRLLLVICLGGTTVASIIAFLANTSVAIVVSLVLLGLFASLYHPAGLSLISTSIKDMGKAMGIHGMAGTLGVACAPIIAGSVTARFGWTYVYLFLGIVGGILMLVLLASAGFHGGHPMVSRRESHSDEQGGIGQELIIVYIIGAVYGLIYRGILTFFPSYLSQRIGYVSDDVGRLGLLSSGIMTISVIGPLVGGYLASSKKMIERNLLLVFVGLAALSVGFYLLKDLWLLLVAIPTILLIFTFQPLQNSLIAKSSHHTRRGAVYGINFTVSFGIGAFASGIGGVFGDRFGLSSIFLLMLGLSLVEVFLIGISKHLRRGGREHGVS